MTMTPGVLDQNMRNLILANVLPLAVPLGAATGVPEAEIQKRMSALRDDQLVWLAERMEQLASGLQTLLKLPPPGAAPPT